MAFSTKLGLVALTAMLVACDKGEPIVPGERLTPRQTIVGASADGDMPLDATDEAAPVAVAISLPAQTSSSDWTQRGSNAAHLSGNAAYSGALSQVWAAKVGAGDSRKNRSSAEPVVAGGNIYTMDGTAGVTATGANGAVLWSADLTPAGEKSGDASGGGLAIGGGVLYATSGYGELVALEAASGKVLWRQDFEVSIGGAPTVANGKVFVLARDGSGWAVDAASGRVLWTGVGSTNTANGGVTGAAAPAVSGDTVVFPFATGELMAMNAADGTAKWMGFVAGGRLGRAYASFNDLTGEPVISGNTLYAGSAAGRLSALDMESGNIIWTAPEGAMSPVVLAGGSLFMVNDEDQLMRLDAGDGSEVWRVDLPYFQNTKKDKKRKGIYAHFGPVLAGGRLITASSDGLLRAFDPASGALMGSANIPGGAAAAPVVAGGTLYVLSKSGQLVAFR